MGTIVQKYGGSSVSTPTKLQKVAQRIVETRQLGHKVVVDVSAMGDTTNQLLSLAKEVSPQPQRRELDMLLTVGERISMSLLSMAIQDLGAPAVSFTGSTEVGGLFMKYSGESNLKTIGLEMGGKSPFLVLEDAKINETLIDNSINSAFWNGGQNCSANMRQIVHKKVKDEFLDKVIKRVKKLKVGDPLDLKSNMGSMISKGHLQTVDGYIQKGIDEGAKLLSGGVSNNNQKGFYAKPTLFDGLKEKMTIAKEEIFGPVLGVLTVKSDEEALKVASNSKYGLHASVFTQDINRAFHLAKSLPCGTVSVNTFSEGDIKTPFGGYKQSGSLSRDQGTEALNSFLQTKTIWISHQ